MVGGNAWGMFNIRMSHPVSMSVIATDEGEVGNQHPGSCSYGGGGACKKVPWKLSEGKYQG